MRPFLTFLTLWTFVSGPAFAQDRHNWQEDMRRLHPGDRIRISSQTEPVDASFIAASETDLTTDSGTTKKEDVLKIERLIVKKGGSRSRHALIGTLIGTGGGAAIGAGVGHCDTSKGFFTNSGCFYPPGLVIAVVAGAGAVTGAVIGATISAGGFKRETIYSAN
jgi:hypothetical protein